MESSPQPSSLSFPPPPADDGNSPSGASVGLIAGVSIASVVVVTAVALLFYYRCCNIRLWGLLGSNARKKNLLPFTPLLEIHQSARRTDSLPKERGPGTARNDSMREHDDFWVPDPDPPPTPPVPSLAALEADHMAADAFLTAAAGPSTGVGKAAVTTGNASPPPPSPPVSRLSVSKRITPPRPASASASDHADPLVAHTTNASLTGPLPSAMANTSEILPMEVGHVVDASHLLEVEERDTIPGVVPPALRNSSNADSLTPASRMSPWSRQFDSSKQQSLKIPELPSHTEAGGGFGHHTLSPSSMSSASYRLGPSAASPSSPGLPGPGEQKSRLCIIPPPAGLSLPTTSVPEPSPLASGRGGGGGAGGSTSPYGRRDSGSSTILAHRETLVAGRSPRVSDLLATFPPAKNRRGSGSMLDPTSPSERHSWSGLKDSPKRVATSHLNPSAQQAERRNSTSGLPARPGSAVTGPASDAAGGGAGRRRITSAGYPERSTWGEPAGSAASAAVGINTRQQVATRSAIPERSFMPTWNRTEVEWAGGDDVVQPAHHVGDEAAGSSTHYQRPGTPDAASQTVAAQVGGGAAGAAGALSPRSSNGPGPSHHAAGLGGSNGAAPRSARVSVNGAYFGRHSGPLDDAMSADEGSPRTSFVCLPSPPEVAKQRAAHLS